MKKSEIFTELSVKLAQLEAKIDWLIEQQKKEKYAPNGVPADLSKWSRPIGAIGGDIPCIYENLPVVDRNKPMSISCPCKKCSPYALSSGSLSDSGLKQVWMQSEKLTDCISTTYIPSGDLDLK